MTVDEARAIREGKVYFQRGHENHVTVKVLEIRRGTVEGDMYHNGEYVGRIEIERVRFELDYELAK